MLKYLFLFLPLYTTAQNFTPLDSTDYHEVVGTIFPLLDTNLTDICYHSKQLAIENEEKGKLIHYRQGFTGFDEEYAQFLLELYRVYYITTGNFTLNDVFTCYDRYAQFHIRRKYGKGFFQVSRRLYR